MKWIVLLVMVLITVPDTTIKKKPVKPAVKSRAADLKKLNQKQAIQMIKLDSIIKVRDSLKKIKK